jgi:hypothetical protein
MVKKIFTVSVRWYSGEPGRSCGLPEMPLTLKIAAHMQAHDNG